MRLDDINFHETLEITERRMESKKMVDSVNCRVTEDNIGNLTVVFDNGKSIYLQTDYTRGQFAVDCEVVVAPENWDGQPSNLPELWWAEDFEK